MYILLVYWDRIADGPTISKYFAYFIPKLQVPVSKSLSHTKTSDISSSVYMSRHAVPQVLTRDFLFFRK